MSALRIASLLLLVSTLLSTGSCGTRSFLVPRNAFEAAPLRVHRALRIAEASVSAPERLELLARHNPAPCLCPAWEVHLSGVWTRAELRPEPSSTRGTHVVTVRDTRSTVTAQGWAYPVFLVEP